MTAGWEGKLINSGLSYKFFEGSAGIKNDLWSFNISLGNWTLRGGYNSFNSSGISPDSMGEGGWPSSRYGSAYWSSDDGLLFLFGGYFGKFFNLN